MAIITRRKTLCCGNFLRRMNYECGYRKVFQRSYRGQKFNGYTLVSGEDWQKPTVDEIQLVRGLISLTDSQLANRLTVDERTIRKWKSGETSMVYTTGAACAGWPDWVCRSITLSVAEDSLPDASEHESSLVSARERMI